MIRLAVAVLVLLSGCSLLFDPSNVDSGSPFAQVCPESAASCAGRANADAGCNAGTCEYSCNPGFADRDFDVNSASSNGCETNCAGAPAATSPLGAIATVGLPGQVDLLWPESTPPVDGYHVCTSTTPEQCEDFPRAVCDAGLCGANLSGLSDNVRVQTTVRGVSLCAGPASAASLPVSYAPFNGQTKISYQIDTTCGATITDVGSGVMQVAQSSPGLLNQCLTVFQISDGLWGDGFAQVEINVGALGTAPTFVGVALHTDSTTGYAVTASTTLRDDAHCTDLVYRSSRTDNPMSGASSVFCPEAGKWTTLRLSASHGVFSIQAANEGQPLKEAIRWPSPIVGADTRTGRPALLLHTYNTTAQAQFRNFRVSTFSGLPTPGPTSGAWNFAQGIFPPEWKASQTVMRPAKVVACPSWAEAAGCDGGCAPAAASKCVNVSHQGQNGGMALVDLPVGIDVTRPWSMRAHLAAADAGFSNAELVSTMFGPLLDVNGTRVAPLRNATTPLSFPMEFNAWHRAAWNFVPDGGTGSIALALDGNPVSTVARPAGWDRHPGRLQLGGAASFSLYFADFDVYVTDVSISQP